MKYDAFLLTFDTTQTSRKDVIEVIDSLSEIVNWYAFLPASLCLVSRLSAADLSRVIRSRLPDLRFIVVQLGKGQRQGWLPRSAWDFINDPRPAEKVHTAAE
jgi:hypothetical protein